jgi:hypothetical protein
MALSRIDEAMTAALKIKGCDWAVRQFMSIRVAEARWGADWFTHPLIAVQFGRVRRPYGARAADKRARRGTARRQFLAK